MSERCVYCDRDTYECGNAPDYECRSMWLGRQLSVALSALAASEQRSAEWEAAYHKQCAITDERAAEALEATGRAERLSAELAGVRGELNAARAVLLRVTDHYPHCDNCPSCNDEDEPLARTEWCTWCAIIGDADALLAPPAAMAMGGPDA